MKKARENWENLGEAAARLSRWSPHFSVDSSLRLVIFVIRLLGGLLPPLWGMVGFWGEKWGAYTYVKKNKKKKDTTYTPPVATPFFPVRGGVYLAAISRRNWRWFPEGERGGNAFDENDGNQRAFNEEFGRATRNLGKSPLVTVPAAPLRALGGGQGGWMGQGGGRCLIAAPCQS